MTTDKVCVRNILGLRQTFSECGVKLEPTGPKSEGWIPRKFAIRYQRERRVEIVHDYVDTSTLLWMDENNRPTFHWLSPFSIGDGYATAAENIVHALQQSNYNFSVSPCWFVVEKGLRKTTLDALKQPPLPHMVGICLATPGEFVKLPTPYKIGWTMYEATNPMERFPEWRHQWANVNRLWVPAPWVKEVFSRYTKTPIDVVPLAIHDRYLIEPLDRPKPDKFRFVTFGTLTGRKGPVETIKLFKKVFPKRWYPDVEFVLKTRCKMAGYTSGQYPKIDDDRIKIIDGDWMIDQMVDFLASASCMTFLSRGEGFGLPPREAMAMGVPTILGNNTGMEPVCNDKYNWPVPTTDWVESPLGGHWADLDWDTAGDMMKWVYKHRDAAFEKARLGAEWFRANCGNDVVVSSIHDTLSRIDPVAGLFNQKKYAMTHTHLPTFDSLTQNLKSVINPNMPTVLFGLGSGKAYAKLVKSGFNLYGVDSSKEAIETTHNLLENKQNGRIVLGDLYSEVSNIPSDAHALIIEDTPNLTMPQLRRFIDTRLKSSGHVVIAAPAATSTSILPVAWNTWGELQWRCVLQDYALETFKVIQGKDGYHWFLMEVTGFKHTVRGSLQKNLGRIIEGNWRQPK